MNSQVKAMDDEAIRRGRDSWLPVIRPERRSVLERIHSQVAAEWSRALADYLRQGDQVEFDGLGFETFGANSEADIGNSLAAVFAIDGTTVGGLLRISAELAAGLAETQFGLAASSGQAPRSAPFTRLEMALLQEQMRILLERLGAAYDAAGQYEPAGADCDQAIKFDPGNADSFATRCNLRNDQGQYDAAIADCDQAVKLDPDDPDCYTARALASYGLAQYLQTMEDARRALDVPGLAISTAVLFGSPAECIAEQAAAPGVGMVVVGSRGHGAVARVFLGSVSDRLVHICPKPVLVVH